MHHYFTLLLLPLLFASCKKVSSPAPLARSEESAAVTQPIIANSNTLADPTKAASIFFAACRANDLDVLKKVISERQQASLKKFGDTLEMFAEAWAKNNIVSIDGSDPPTKTAGGRTITEVNVTIATDSGNRPAKITFALEESGWKMDEN